MVDNKSILGYKECSILNIGRLYRIYRNMINRCYNKNTRGYRYYGSRNIKVCKEWRNDRCSFVFWAITHGYADNLSIDRIDNDGLYSPENCRWVDVFVQNNNTRVNRYINYNNKKYTMAQLARELNIPAYAIRNGLNRNAEIYDIISSYRRKHCA